MQIQNTPKYNQMISYYGNHISTLASVSINQKKYFSDSYFSDRAREEQQEIREWQDSDATDQVRLKFQQPIVNIFCNLAYPYLRNKNILEIGCGKIEKNCSYLSSFFPEHSWTFSDFYPAPSHNLKYIKWDLTDNSAKIDDQFNSIVGCGVLDTVPYSSLSKIFQKFSLMLKPNDTCIHFSDLAFHLNQFYDRVIEQNPNCVFLPHRDYTNKINKIKKADFNKILKENANLLSPHEMHYWKFWGEQRPVLQAITIYDSCKEFGLSDTRNLCQRTTEIFSSSLETVESDIMFPKELKFAAENNGFTVDVCEFRSHVVATNLPEGEVCNYELYSPGYYKYFDCLALDPTIKIFNAKVHVFVARKN